MADYWLLLNPLIAGFRLYRNFFLCRSLFLLFFNLCFLIFLSFLFLPHGIKSISFQQNLIQIGKKVKMKVSQKSARLNVLRESVKFNKRINFFWPIIQKYTLACLSGISTVKVTSPIFLLR